MATRRRSKSRSMKRSVARSASKARSAARSSRMAGGGNADDFPCTSTPAICEMENR